MQQLIDLTTQLGNLLNCRPAKDKLSGVTKLRKLDLCNDRAIPYKV